MNDMALENLSKRMQNDFYVGVVGSVRSGKSSFINSFFRLMVLPDIDDEFLKHKILDELPQSAAGRQIMTVEPKFIPSASLQMNINDTIMNLRFVDCVGEIIPSSEGYGSDQEPRLVKTPWFDEAIPFKEAAMIGTEKVIFNHSNLGVYVTSDGSFGEFKRYDYENIENSLIPKMKDLNKPFVILLNTKDPTKKETLDLAKSLEDKWQVSCIALNVLNMTKDDCNLLLSKALEEFPIADLEILLPDYINVVGDDIKLKADIKATIEEIENKYSKVKDVDNICYNLRKSNLFSNVKLDLLEKSSGKASIILDLDDSNVVSSDAEYRCTIAIPEYVESEDKFYMAVKVINWNNPNIFGAGGGNEYLMVFESPSAQLNRWTKIIDRNYNINIFSKKFKSIIYNKLINKSIIFSKPYRIYLSNKKLGD